MLELHALTKELGGKMLFSGLSARLPEPVVVIEGANGAGKTTLLRMITGVMLPDSGRIEWNGQGHSAYLPRLGVCPADEGTFYPLLSVRQNLTFFAVLQRIRGREVEERLRRFSPFPIDYLDLRLERCSLGMRQKVKIARALLHDPDLLLLDEPLNGLDVESRALFLGWLAERSRRPGRTTVVVQHGLEASLPRYRLEGGGLRAC